MGARCATCEIRIAADGVTREDLVAQEKLSLSVSELLSRARQAQTRIDSKRKELAEVIEQGGRAVRAAQRLDKELAGLRAELVTGEGPYPKPKLINQISYLGSMLDRADQKPGRDAYIRLDELQSILAQVLETLDSLEQLPQL